jgi:hypothetical protein
MRSLAIALVVVTVGAASPALAQTAEDGWAPPTETSRPTSGEASFLSGRTLGTGQVLMAAALGWPGFWAHVELAPDSALNIGVRAAVVYGSPVMGLVAGAGGELVVPIRVHVFGERDVDVALRIAPQISTGEGRLFGGADGTSLANQLGVSSRIELGALLGWRSTERFTMFFGLSAAPGLTWLEGQSVRAIGVFQGTIGVEALMSLETMLFAEVQGGVGVVDASGLAFTFYPQQEIFRISLGLAYVL